MLPGPSHLQNAVLATVAADNGPSWSSSKPTTVASSLVAAVLIDLRAELVDTGQVVQVDFASCRSETQFHVSGSSRRSPSSKKERALSVI